jgi:outer membrane protein assembly factor BamB
MKRSLGKMRIGVIAALGAIAFAILAVAIRTTLYAQLATSPWPIFRHDRAHTGRSECDAGAQPGAAKWRFSAPDGRGLSDPVIGAEGDIYISSLEYHRNTNSYSSHLYALDSNGTPKWTFEPSGLINAEASPAIGIDGIIFAAGREFIPNTPTTSSYIYAVHPDGTLKWKCSVEASELNSPTIDSEGVIYVGSIDLSADGSQSGDLYAINPDGTLKWKYTTGNLKYSSPAISADGTIYVGSYGAVGASAINLKANPLSVVRSIVKLVASTEFDVYAINRDGTLKWKFKTDGPLSSSPAIGTDGTIYVGNQKLDGYGEAPGNLYAINSDGTLRWKFTAGKAIYATPAIGADGVIYVGSYDKYLYAINPDGTLKWKFTDIGGSVGSSAVVSSDGTILLGGLYALDPDGKLKWKREDTGAPVIGADGTLYFECGPGAGLCAIGGIGR